MCRLVSYELEQASKAGYGIISKAPCAATSGRCAHIGKTISNCSKLSLFCRLDCVSTVLMPGKFCFLLVSGLCLEADHNLSTFNLGWLGLGEQPLISATCFSGGTSRPNNTCIKALTHVSQLWVALFLLCPTVRIMSLREEVREPLRHCTCNNY